MSVRRHLVKRCLAMGVLVGASAFSTLSWAEVGCGATLGPGGSFVLTQNLTCPENSPGLILDGPVTLDMKGYTLDCDNSSVGIEIIGSEATLKKGVVDDCGGEGIRVAGEGHHTIKKMKVLGGFDSTEILVDSSHNTLFGNSTRSSQGVGFLVRGSDNYLYNNRTSGGESGFEIRGELGEPEASRNLLKNNVARRAFNGFVINIRSTANSLVSNKALKMENVGFGIIGEDNRILWNTARQGDRNGFELGDIGGNFLATGTKMIGNTAIKNGMIGILVLENSTDNTMIGNTAFKNTEKDLVDGNMDPPCDNNTWKFNFFKSRNQTCIR